MNERAYHRKACRYLRSLLALILMLALSPARTFAQTNSSDKVYEQLSKIAIHSKIEITLLSQSRIRGELLAFDRAEVTISKQPAPISLADVKSVKRLTATPGWNPLWGFSRSWKTAVITIGIVVAVAVIAAKNTR